MLVGYIDQHDAEDGASDKHGFETPGDEMLRFWDVLFGRGRDEY